MSGNPFRRQPVPQITDEEAVEDEASSAPRNSKLKTKRVKILTPPRSPEDPPRRASLGRISPPPPVPPPSREDDDELDSYTDADAKLREASLNTRRNSDSRPPLSANPAPYNPFARTLATSEALYGLQNPDPVQEYGVSTSDGQSKDVGAGRPAMDVDTFKNILMTGSAPPVLDPPVEIQRPQVLSGSDSGGRLSGQTWSINNADPDVRPSELSLDDLESASSDDDQTGHKLSMLDTPLGSHQTITQPSKGPRVVSFENFDQSLGLPRDDLATHRPQEQSTSISTNGLETAPLDPYPTVTQLDQAQFSQAGIGNEPMNVPPAKKAPPPPPTSRRQARPRSVSNVTDDSIAEEPAPLTKTSDRTAAAPPPPPPSRKPRPISHSPSPRVVTPSETPSPAPIDHKVMPPPPPRRNANKTPNSIRRTASNASRTSIPRGENPSHQGPPAPPPRRGVGGNHRVSGDFSGSSMSWATSSGRRNSSLSVESETSGHAALGVSTDPAAPRTPSIDSTASKDILADMSAFQAEIDALRARSQGQNERR